MTTTQERLIHLGEAAEAYIQQERTEAARSGTTAEKHHRRQQAHRNMKDHYREQFTGTEAN